MTKRHSHDLSKVNKIPKGQNFVQLTGELLSSPAWCSMTINCRRLIDFLMIEQLNHAGQENGNLCATYDQLVDFGIPRRLVHRTITEAERLKLIDVERGGRKNSGISPLSRFTITFFPMRKAGNGAQGFYEPTHEWRSITEEEAQRIRESIMPRKKTTLRK
jgi:hypothetical protein